MSYAPSAQVLVNSRLRVGRTAGYGLYQTVNPPEDPKLRYTDCEAEAVVGWSETGLSTTAARH